MLLRSRNIIRLLYANNNAQIIYYYGKNNKQFTEKQIYDTIDKNNQKDRNKSKTQQMAQEEIKNLRQYLEKNFKKDPSMINEKQICPVIENLQKCIPKMNYQEICRTLQAISDWNRFYYQFKKQYLNQFFKFLQMRAKEMIINTQPPMSFDHILNLFYLFSKVKHQKSISKQILQYSFNRLIPDQKIQQLTPQNLKILKRLMKIIIFNGIRRPILYKESLIESINAFHQQKILPVMNETIWMIHQFSINLSQLPTWYNQYFQQVYQKVLKGNNIFDHMNLLKSMLDLKIYDKMIWGEIRMKSTYIFKMCEIHKSLLRLLNEGNLESLPTEDILYFLEILYGIIKQRATDLAQVNKMIKAMKIQQKTIDINQFIVKIIDHYLDALNQNLLQDQKQGKEFIFSFSLCLHSLGQSNFSQSPERVASLYKFLLEFIKRSFDEQKNLIQYIRIIEFIVYIRKHLQHVDLKEFKQLLKKLQVQLNNKLRSKNFQYFQTVRLRVVLKIMNLQSKTQNQILKQYLLIKKQNSFWVFQNLSRTMLADENLPQIIQICKDTMAKKQTKGINLDQLDIETWYIMITSIRTQEMIIFWRPYLKKMAKSNKFIGFINATLCQEKFKILPQHIQLIAEMYLECKYRDCYSRTSIDKFLRFSHTDKILKQLWAHSIHSIKHIYIAKHMFETYAICKNSQNISLCDAVPKCIFFLNNLISLPNNFLYSREIGYLLRLFFQYSLESQKLRDFSIDHLLKDNLVWMKSNNQLQDLFRQISHDPALMKNLSLILKYLFKNISTNSFDCFALKQIGERYYQKKLLYSYNNFANLQHFNKIEKLLNENLSEQQLNKQYTVAQIFNCVVRDLKSVNQTYFYSRLIQFLQQDKSQQLSIEAIQTLAQKIIRKSQENFKRQQLELMKSILNYNYRHYNIEYLSFSGLYTLMQLHLHTKTSLPANFPTENLRKQNKFSLIQIAHFFNQFGVKIPPESAGQLYKYLIQSRFFEYYFAIDTKQIFQPGCKKIASLFRIILINAKKQYFIKIVDLIFKEIKKIPKASLQLLSTQIAVDIYAAKSINDTQINDISHRLYDCLNKQCLKQIIENKFQALSLYQKQFHDCYQQHKLMPIQLSIELQQTNLSISLFQNEQKQLVILKKEADLWNSKIPNNQDYLISLLISNKLKRATKYKTV